MDGWMDYDVGKMREVYLYEGDGCFCGWIYRLIEITWWNMYSSLSPALRVVVVVIMVAPIGFFPTGFVLFTLFSVLRL